jgi:Zn-dependent protease with chaperone function
MDFFEHQQQARRHTALMIVLFVLAVAATVIVVDLIGVLVYTLTNHPRGAMSSATFALGRTPGSVHLGIAAVTLGVIGFGSGLRMFDLAAGGTAVANMVGARYVKRDTSDLMEKRLLNLVEEMALASGITVPLVYVMDKQTTINAFAAGYSPNEAVVVLTRGALEKLNRDELQGVIGHEFSHILNGDMRLNVRLIGVIAGLVLIGLAGRFLMNVGQRGRADPRPILLGVALWTVGSIGVFFGSLIKAAISRQREFLADASAVQFTRNPEGICGALFKIGVEGSRVDERHADELSHMYFGDSVDSAFGFMDTHPPLEERIERILGPGAARELVERMENMPHAAPESAPPSPVVDELMSPLYAPGASAWGRSASRAWAGRSRRTSTTCNVCSPRFPSRCVPPRERETARRRCSTRCCSATARCAPRRFA